MNFIVSELRNHGVIEKEEDLDPAVLLYNPPAFVEFNQPVKVQAEAKLTQSEILITCEAQTVADLTCGRCLERFKKNIEVDFDQSYSPEETSINIDNDVRENIFIEIPPSLVCKESCKGLCPTCGKNKNLVNCTCTQNQDPRWSGLKGFQPRTM